MSSLQLGTSFVLGVCFGDNNECKLLHKILKVEEYSLKRLGETLAIIS